MLDLRKDERREAAVVGAIRSGDLETLKRLWSSSSAPRVASVAGEVDWLALAIAVAAFIGMVRWKWDIVPVVAGGALIGLFKLAF